MTYGCNLKLASNMLHTFQDLCAQFLEAMKVARASEEVSWLMHLEFCSDIHSTGKVQAVGTYRS